MNEDKPKAKRGFAAMSPEMRRKISVKGGQTSSGNFKNNPKRASEAAKKMQAIRAEQARQLNVREESY